ncbi:MAG: hypothetical protein ACI9C4_000436 [Paraglaciecola sp.]|jgi:hypothetical protein
MISSQQTKIETVANDIREYFVHNPNAGDTVDGIVTWWIARQRLKNAKNIVQDALEYLVNQGELQKQVLAGREIYVREALH